MPATKTTLDAVLKDYYIGPLQEQLNNEVMVLNMFEKAKITWAGRQGVVPVHVGRNEGALGGVAFKGEGDALPTAYNQVTKRLTFTAAYLYGRFQVSGPAIASAAKGGTASFIGALELEMDKLKDDVRNTADRTMTSGGRVVGFLNQRKAEGGAGTWEFRGDFQKILDVRAAKGANLDIAVIDCSNNTLTGEAVTYERITTTAKVDTTHGTFSPAAGTIRLDDALDTTGVAIGFGAALVIIDGDAAVDAILDQEPTGIYGNLGDETLFGVDRGSVAGDAMPLQSVIMVEDVDNNGDAEALGLERMQQVIDAISVTSGMDIDVILMNPLMRSRYTGLLSGSIFKTVEKATTGDGGFLGLSYAGVPIKSARHVDNGLILFLNTKCWKLAVLEDGKFADLDGSVLSRVSGNDSWEGFYKWYYNHYCYRPNANGVLTGITFA